MHIINVMFGRELGGLEQSFLDYCAAQRDAGHQVTAITHPMGQVNNALVGMGISPKFVSNKGEWDPFASYRLSRHLHALRADAILAHGNRAVSLCTRAAHHVPVVGVTHNYKLRRFSRLDAVIALTSDLAEKVVEAGVAQENVYLVPNMVAVPHQITRPKRRQPPVIGTMGRFVEKKGFDIFIEALALLKQRGVAFEAFIGGDGEERDALHSCAEKYDLSKELYFRGWVWDKQRFFQDIDVFCVPSLHEPFGIVLLEAFAAKVPVVTTDSEGPAEIATHGVHAQIVKKGDAAALADGLQTILEDETGAVKMTENAYTLVKQRYSTDVVGIALGKTLQDIAVRYQKKKIGT